MPSGAAFSGGSVMAQPNAVAYGSEVTVVSGVASRRIRLTGMTIGLSAAAAVQFKDGNSGTVIFTTPLLAANTPYTIDIGEGTLLTAGNNLRAISTAAASVTGTIFGTLED